MNRIVFFCLGIVLLGCGSDRSSEVFDPYGGYIKNSFTEYADIYAQVNDSIAQWITDSLSLSLHYQSKDSWQIDSAIIFNTGRDLLFVTFNNSERRYRDSRLDQIRQLKGIKLENQWYFYFAGGVLALPREFYKADVYEPLTFEELSYLAHKELYPNFFFDKKDGSFKSNDAWFDRKFFSGKYKTIEELAPIIINKSKERNKRKIDPEELNKIKKKMAASKRPPPPEVELSLSEKIFGKKPKLFDSKAWKNRKK